MSEAIVSREAIDKQARLAAIDSDSGRIVTNPYPVDTEAWHTWQASFYRWQMDLAGELTE